MPADRITDRGRARGRAGGRRIVRALGVPSLALGVMLSGLTAFVPPADAAATSLAGGTRAVDLHSAFEADLGHVVHGPIAGIVYGRGHQPATPSPGSGRVAIGPAAPGSCGEPYCPLVYNGGPVQHDPHVYLLLWGPNWTTNSQAGVAAYLEDFYQGLGETPGDSWSTITSQYGDGNGYPTFTGSVFEGAFNDSSTPPATIRESSQVESVLATEAQAFVTSQRIADIADAQIVIATQSGVCPNGFAAASCGAAQGSYCAWHSATGYGQAGVSFTNLPYLLDAGSSCGQDFVNSNGTYDGLSIVAGHEYAESVTDPLPDTGWIDTSDASGGEIGDKCAWSASSADVTLATGSFAMQPLYSNNAYGAGSGATGCVMSAAAPQVTSFASSPSSPSVGQQFTLTAHLATALPSGFSTSIVAEGGATLAQCTSGVSCSTLQSLSQPTTASYGVVVENGLGQVVSGSGTPLTVTASVAPSTPTVSARVYDAATHAPWSGNEVTGARAYGTATVSSASGPIPTGTVTYEIYNGGSCSGDALSDDPVTISGGTVPPSATSRALGAGTYSLQASYGGNGSYNSATSSCQPFSLGRSAETPLAITSNRGTYGSPLRLRTSGGSGTGAVSYRIDNRGSGRCTLREGVLQAGRAGTCTLSAEKAGDHDYKPVASAPTVIRIARARTSAAIHLSRAVVNYGDEQVEILRVGVSTHNSALRPSGEVRISGTSCTVRLLRSSGSCRLTATELAVGSHFVVARYLGNVDFLPSASAGRLTVKPAASVHRVPRLLARIRRG